MFSGKLMTLIITVAVIVYLFTKIFYIALGKRKPN